MTLLGRMLLEQHTFYQDNITFHSEHDYISMTLALLMYAPYLCDVIVHYNPCTLLLQCHLIIILLNFIGLEAEILRLLNRKNSMV